MSNYADPLDADALPCGLLALRDDGRIVAANRKISELLGNTKEALISQHIDTLLTPAARVLYHSHIFPMLKLHGFIEDVEITLRDAAGNRLDAMFSAQRADGEGSAITRCLVTRLRQRRQLEEQLLNTRLAAQHLPGVLFQLLEDSSGHFSLPFASESLRNFFGVSAEILRENAAPLWRAVAPEDIAHVRTSLAESAAAGTRWHCRFRTVIDKEIRWLGVHAAPQRRTDGSILWHGYVADITEHYAHEQALLEKNTAEQASRSKSEFIARMSHELRTPLNSILGFARLLLIELSGTLDPAQREQLKNIEASGGDLLHLINELLDISRIETGNVKFDIHDIALTPLIEKIKRQILPAAIEKQIALQLHVGENIIVRADAQRLQQILINLISNAIKYNRHGGKVVIEIKRDREFACISVGDEGAGLSEEQQQLLFQPFNRLGAEHSGIEGTGLGLTIARALVEQMGGNIIAASQQGVGSVFTVKLPLGDGALKQTGETRSVASLPAIPIGIRRVLYVEDNPVNVLLMRALFKRRPQFQLFVANSAVEALQLLKAENPQLLLLDMQLPDASGSELLVNIRRDKAWQDIPAIAVSADAMPEDIGKAVALGFCDYWTKPLDIDRALRVLDQTLVGEEKPVGNEKLVGKKSPADKK